jgi:hypothetical protein
MVLDQTDALTAWQKTEKRMARGRKNQPQPPCPNALFREN